MNALLTPETSPRPLLQGQIEFCLRHAAETAEPVLEPLLRHLAAASRCALLSDDVQRVVVGGPSRMVRWERAWKLASWTGIALRVDLVVDERAPELIQARVDGDTVAACGLGDTGGWRQLAPALVRALSAPATRPLAA